MVHRQANVSKAIDDFIAAASEGNTMEMQRLLKLHGQDVQLSQKSNGKSGHIKFIDAIGSNGTTALITAISRRNEGVIGFLLQNKANPNRADHMGYPPLYHAAFCNGNTSSSIALTLLSNSPPANPNVIFTMPRSRVTVRDAINRTQAAHKIVFSEELITVLDVAGSKTAEEILVSDKPTQPNESGILSRHPVRRQFKAGAPVPI